MKSSDLEGQVERKKLQSVLLANVSAVAEEVLKKLNKEGHADLSLEFFAGNLVAFCAMAEEFDLDKATSVCREFITKLGELKGAGRKFPMSALDLEEKLRMIQKEETKRLADRFQDMGAIAIAFYAGGMSSLSNLANLASLKELQHNLDKDFREQMELYQELPDDATTIN